jgi:hypothetical protein
VADSPEKLDDLRRLLRECSAQLSEPGGARGSGVFVDERHLLTCAHVVKAKGVVVTVQPSGREPRPGTVVEFEEGDALDLALVEVDRLEGEPPQPAALLDAGLDENVPYYAVGWPKGDLAGIEGIEELRYNGHSKGEDELLVLDAGQANVTSGLSGGPVLDSHTGAVVALVQYTRSRDVPMGGGAIPIARAARLFPAVAALVESPPLAARRWKNLLGEAGLSALGKPTRSAASLDVIVDGDRKAWTVRLDGEQPVTVQSLPERVSDALFYWAQRRQIYAREDVTLLGQLLAGAVFPPAIAESIEHGRQADSLLLRLDVGNDELFDVPWEFVTLRAEDDTHAAAAENVSFVRVAPHPSPADVDTSPRRPEDGDAGVVSIVVQPSSWDWQTKMKQYVGPGFTGWPAKGEVAKQLRESFRETHSLALTTLDDPEKLTADDVKAELARIGPELVHYTGFARWDREAQLALSDGGGDGRDDVSWQPIDDFFDAVASAGARVLVVELLRQPFGENWELLEPHVFRSALRGSVNAVVLTRFPMLLAHLRDFNNAFYAAVGEGAPVEIAVQRARKRVQSNKQYGDYGAFGSFTLITGERADLRLVQPAPSQAGQQSPTLHTTKQPGAEKPPPATSEPSGDLFVKQ